VVQILCCSHESPLDLPFTFLKVICLQAEEQLWGHALLGNSSREAAVGIGIDLLGILLGIGIDLAIDLQHP